MATTSKKRFFVKYKIISWNQKGDISTYSKVVDADYPEQAKLIATRLCHGRAYNVEVEEINAQI